jgi:glycosyltransferase involved in cell wall biosynthesis
MSRRRLLFVASSFPRWAGDGSAPFLLHLAEDLQALGWAVEVLAPHAPGAARSETLAGVAVGRFRYAWPVRAQRLCYGAGALHNLGRDPWAAAKLPQFVLAEWLAIARRLASGRYDLVQSHWILPQGLLAALAARPLGVPHVATIHGSDLFALQGRLPTRLKRLALRWADAITVNSSATEARARTLAAGAARLRRIPMGAAEPTPAPGRVAELRGRYRKGDGPLLVFAGRLVEQKGILDFVRAVALLAPQVTGAAGVVLGDGPLRAAAEELARSLGVADRICFAGQVAPEAVGAHLAAADVFVAPSRRTDDGAMEGQGLGIVEAMLARCPVVATASGGIVDAVRPGETGLLVAEEAPAEIAEAVRRLVSDSALTERLRERALDHARRNFTRQVSARAFSELFEAVIAEKRVARAFGRAA